MPLNKEANIYIHHQDVLMARILLALSLYQSVYLSVCLSVCLSRHLSLSAHDELYAL